MKYILKNIHGFIKEECIVFLLFCFNIIVSVAVLHIAYGIYDSVNKSMLENEYGEAELWIDFDENDYPPKSKLMQALDSISAETRNRLYYAVDGWFAEDIGKPEYNQGYRFSFNFRYSGENITCDEEVCRNLKESGYWGGGTYFTPQQYQNGELVAIVGTPDSYLEEIEDYPYHYSVTTGGFITIHGKKYRCIGKQEMANTPFIPFTAAPDNFVIKWICFGKMGGVMTRAEYIEITDAIREQFPGLSIPEYPVPDVEEGMIYKSILIICVLIAVISALVHAVLYQYIIDQRKRTLDIFRISGLTLHRAGRIYLGECLLLLAICYGIGLVIFRCILFPQLSSIYYHMEEAFSAKTYLILGSLYLFIVYAVLQIKLICSFQKTQMIERI